MERFSPSDTALATLVIRVWRARGGAIPPVHAIAIEHTDTVRMRLIDMRPELHVIGSWTFADREDLSTIVRLLEERDRAIGGLVFHHRRGSDGCFWEFVHPRTFETSHMFARSWRAPYGEL